MKTEPAERTPHDASSPDPRTTRLGSIRRSALAGLLLNVTLSVMKIAGGVLGFSHALVADGIHSFSDCISDAAILIGARYWLSPSDENHPHGHARIETLITGLVGALVMLTGILLAWRSFSAVIHPSAVRIGWIAFWITAVSIVSKEALYRWTIVRSRKLRSAALAANAWHHRSDSLSSIPVAVAVLVTRLDPSVQYIDGIAGGLVSVLVLYQGFRITRPALRKLIDAAAPREVCEELMDSALSVPGVLGVHDLRTRFQGEGIQADLHVVVSGGLSMSEAFGIAEAVETALYSSGPGVVDVLVRLEPSVPRQDD